AHGHPGGPRRRTAVQRGHPRHRTGAAGTAGRLPSGAPAAARVRARRRRHPPLGVPRRTWLRRLQPEPGGLAPRLQRSQPAGAAGARSGDRGVDERPRPRRGAGAARGQRDRSRSVRRSEAALRRLPAGDGWRGAFAVRGVPRRRSGHRRGVVVPPGARDAVDAASQSVRLGLGAARPAASAGRALRRARRARFVGDAWPRATPDQRRRRRRGGRCVLLDHAAGALSPAWPPGAATPRVMLMIARMLLGPRSRIVLASVLVGWGWCSSAVAQPTGPGPAEPAAPDAAPGAPPEAASEADATAPSAEAGSEPPADPRPPPPAVTPAPEAAAPPSEAAVVAGSSPSAKVYPPGTAPPSGTAPAHPGHYAHDGFYLRVALGGGALFMRRWAEADPPHRAPEYAD